MRKKYEVNEDGLKIYFSLWKNMLIVVGGLVFAIMGFYIIQDDDCSEKTKIIGGWLGIIFFGGSAILILAGTLYTAICRIPALIIYEDRLELFVQARNEYQVIHFADVKSFRIININSAKMIAIDYKSPVMKCKFQAASTPKRWLMKFNSKCVGAAEGIPVSNMAIKGRELCRLLDELLDKARARDGNDMLKCQAAGLEGNVPRI